MNIKPPPFPYIWQFSRGDEYQEGQTFKDGLTWKLVYVREESIYIEIVLLAGCTNL